VSPSSYKFSRVDHPSLVETAPHAAPQWTISETLSKHTSVRLNLVHAHLIWAAADQAPRAGFSFGFVVFYVILISVNHFWFHLPSLFTLFIERKTLNRIGFEGFCKKLKRKKSENEKRNWNEKRHRRKASCDWARLNQKHAGRFSTTRDYRSPAYYLELWVAVLETFFWFVFLLLLFSIGLWIGFHRRSFQLSREHTSEYLARKFPMNRMIKIRKSYAK